jgi:uncharacterized protein (DUF2267 family)
MLHEIDSSGRIPPHVTPSAASAAVLCVLTQALSTREAQHLSAVLPEALRSLLRLCILHRDEPSSVFDRDEFFSQVQLHLNITRREAEVATQTVFAVVRNELAQKAIRHIMGQLPKDLRAVWLPQEAGAPGASRST